MLPKNKRLHCLLLLLIASELCAQWPDYHVQLFDESFGLRTGDVRKVITDPQGYVWILHHDRVQRFDGKLIDDFVLDENMQSLLCDQSGGIWAASFSTLYTFDLRHHKFKKVVLDTTQRLSITALYQFHGPGVLAITTKGLYVLAPGSSHFQLHTDPVLGDSLRIQNRGSDALPNTLFFSSKDSLIKYDIRNHTRKALALPEHNIRTVTALTDNVVLVSIWKGILYQYDFSANRITEIDLRNQISNVQDYFLTVFKALPTGRSTFLLATSKGILTYDIHNGRFRKMNFFHKGKPLEGNHIFMDLTRDASDMIWSAYRNYGLIAFDVAHENIGLVRNAATDIQHAWDNHVRNFAEDEHGNLWLATYNGFARWNASDGTIDPFFANEGSTTMLNHPSVRGIVYDGKNLILGQTNRGVWLYNPPTQQYRRPVFSNDSLGARLRTRLEDSFIEQIYTLLNGDHVVAGSNGSFIMSKNTYQVREPDFPGKRDNQNFTYQDQAGTIWIGTESALYQLDSSMQYICRVPKKQTRGRLNSVCDGKNGTLIAAGNGLYQIQMRDTIPVVTSVDPFFDSLDIHTVYRDQLDRLWLATSEGLFRFNPATREIQSFSHFENIEGNAFYPNSYWRAANGLLFMGSTRGIIYFNPEKAGPIGDSLRVFITGITINDDDTTYAAMRDAFAVKHFQHNLAIDFTSPYFGNATKLKYRYKLVGLYDAWNYNGNNTTARFHALPPGHYTFSAAASINGIDWFPADREIEFTIQQPFWLTWWFMLLVVAAIASILYGLYRYQLNKKLEVERLRLRIARDLHDDIGSALSNIHIISSMALQKQKGDEGTRQLFDKIKSSSRTMLDNMQDIVWAIHPQHDTLDQILSRMNEFAGEICESADIGYTFTTPENIDAIRLPVHQRKDLFLIFKEAMNNAVKYSGGSAIDISLTVNPQGRLRMLIADNGHGFTQGNGHTGNGLSNMKQRALQLRGQVTIHSVVGEGTRVELDMPIT